MPGSVHTFARSENSAISDKEWRACAQPGIEIPAGAHGVFVGLDLAWRVGALNLDGDAVAVREGCAVDLADRGGGDRGLVEFGEELLDRELEVFSDDALDVFVGERAHVVLEGLQLGQDVRRDDVGAGREELAELDERRAELVQHLPQVLAALRRCAFGVPRSRQASGQQVGQTVGLEEVTEAVLDRDLGDLGDAAEVPRSGCGHAVSVPRATAHAGALAGFSVR